MKRMLHDQLSKYMEDKLSPLLCGFRKKYSTQHALLRMIERWRHCLYNSGAIATVLLDLSKAYDCIPHDLIAKLYAYGLDNSALSLLHSYLSNRKQRVKVNNCFSDWINVVIGISQGSVLGPLLFNIFINDLFLTVSDNDLCIFADDNTLYKCSDYLSQEKRDIEAQCSLIIRWFNENSMKMNPEKCHAFIHGKKIMPEHFTIRVGDVQIVPEHEVTLLGITLDSRLNFNTHINNILKEVSKKVSALVPTAKYLNKSQKTFIYSQFNYCPLVWMFSSKDTNKKIDGPHKRVLRLLYYDYTFSYEELLLKDDSVCVHVKNLQFLMIEISKTIHDENPNFMRDVFVREDTRYDLRSEFRLKVPRVNSGTYGLHSACFRGSQLWNTLPNHFKIYQVCPHSRTK